MRKTNSLERMQQLSETKDMIEHSETLKYLYGEVCEVWKFEHQEDSNYLLEWIIDKGMDYVYMKVTQNMLLDDKERSLRYEHHLSMKEIHYMELLNIKIQECEIRESMHLSMLEYALIKKLRDIEYPRKAFLAETIIDMTDKLFK